jgi:signal transduction histidine kinase
VSFYHPNRHLSLAVIIGSVVLLSGVIIGVTLPVRRALHEQVLRREAAALEAVVEIQREGGTREVRDLGVPVEALDVFYALLESPRLDDLVAMQLFAAEGEVALVVPDAAFVEELPIAERVAQPTAVYHSSSDTAGGLGLAVEAADGPWLEVVVPVTLGNGADAERVWARYWLDGRPVAAELAEVDHRLWWQVGLSMLGGNVILVAGLGWAFRRLARQQEDLARANRELLLNSKTAAIGAISAHLMHGLKNPLAGLEGFIAAGENGQTGGADEGEAWRLAAETTRRVRRLINGVMDVLRDETAAVDYAVPIEEVVTGVMVKSRSGAAAARVELEFNAAVGKTEVAGRTAALGKLALGNVIDNAIAAVAPGGRVTVGLVRRGDVVCIRVVDTGPGLPERVRRAEFTPVASDKPGGAGLGLALSHELLRHAGGELALESTGAHGTAFRLTLPVTEEIPAPASVS